MLRMAKTDYLNQTTTQILNKRFKEVQKELKETKCVKLNDFRAFVIDKEPQYNCPEGWEAVAKAWYGKKPDLRLTELIQEYRTELLSA